jgi:hypothetical protein
MSANPHTPEQRDAAIETVLEGLRKGLPEYNAAEAAGISYPTWWRWRQEMPGLTERAYEAKRARIPLLEDALWKAALKGKVSAIMAWLEKEDAGWRNRAKDLTPQQNVMVFNGNAAAMIALLDPLKREKLRIAMVAAGLLPGSVKQIGTNGHVNGTNGNGTH